MVLQEGQKVVIRSDLIGGETYGGVYFNPSMRRFCGCIAEIYGRGFYRNEYRLTGINGIGEWVFSTEMLCPMTMEGSEFYKLDKYPHRVASKEEANCMGSSSFFELSTDLFGVGKAGDRIKTVIIGGNTWLSEEYLPMNGILSDNEGKEYKEEE